MAAGDNQNLNDLIFNLTDSINSLGKDLRSNFHDKAEDAVRDGIEDGVLKSGLGLHAIRFNNKLGEAVTALDRLDRAAQARGIRQDQLFSENIEVLKGLPGTFGEPLAEALRITDAGISKGLTPQLAKTIVAMKTTDQSTDGLIRVLTNLRGIGQLSIEATDALASIVLKTAQTYRISSDRIVSSVEQLLAQTAFFAFTGVSKQITEAAALLTGPGKEKFSQQITDVFKILTDRDWETILSDEIL